MPECPQCQCNDTEFQNSEQIYREQDQFTTVVEYYYVCNVCGCEFKIRDVTSRTVEITKRGKEQ